MKYAGYERNGVLHADRDYAFGYKLTDHNRGIRQPINGYMGDTPTFILEVMTRYPLDFAIGLKVGIEDADKELLIKDKSKEPVNQSEPSGLWILTLELS